MNLPFQVIWENWQDIVDGLMVTLEVSSIALVLSIIFGIFVGVLRVVPVRIVRQISGFYVEFFRNIPPLVQLFFVFYALPHAGIVLSPFVSGVVGLTLYHVSFVAEIIRAGVLAVGDGYMQAGRALGFGYFGALRYVVGPQAIYIVLPALGNLFISLIKTSSLVAAIGCEDLMFQAELLNERTYRTFEVLGFVALVYIALSLLLTAVFHKLEFLAARRLAGHVT